MISAPPPPETPALQATYNPGQNSLGHLCTKERDRHVIHKIAQKNVTPLSPLSNVGCKKLKAN